jgi:hypothetical protein
MAGRLFSAVKAAEELTASNTETLIQVVAAANHGFIVCGWGVAFAGTGVNEEPIQIDLIRQTTAGTSASLTLVKWDDSIADSIDSSGLQDFTAEPTAGDVLASTESHPQAGYEIWYPEGKEPRVGAADRIGIRVLTPSGVNPSASVYMVCEE